MRIRLLILITLSMCAGCNPSAEPAGSPPTSAELHGTWILDNSPMITPDRPIQIPTKGTSSILLNSNQDAKLKNIYLYVVKMPAGRLTETIMSGDASWEIGQQGWQWSVIITISNRVIPLHIMQNVRGDFELHYQTDPEREPFIFKQSVKTKANAQKPSN